MMTEMMTGWLGCQRKVINQGKQGLLQTNPTVIPQILVVNIEVAFKLWKSADVKESINVLLQKQKEILTTIQGNQQNFKGLQCRLDRESKHLIKQERFHTSAKGWQSTVELWDILQGTVLKPHGWWAMPECGNNIFDQGRQWQNFDENNRLHNRSQTQHPQPSSSIHQATQSTLNSIGSTQ